jgi:hypothetical protein
MSAFGRIGRSLAQIIYLCRPSAASDARWRKSSIHVGLRPHRTLVGANHTFMSAFGRIARWFAQIIYSCRPSAASDARLRK